MSKKKLSVLLEEYQTDLDPINEAGLKEETKQEAIKESEEEVT